MLPGFLKTLSAVVLLAVLLPGVFRRLRKRPEVDSAGEEEGKRSVELAITGMTCNHCVANVESAVRGVSGVSGVRVDLANGRVRVEGTADADAIVHAVDMAGYKASV